MTTFDSNILPSPKLAAPFLDGNLRNFDFPPLNYDLVLKSRCPAACQLCSKITSHEPAESVYFEPGIHAPLACIEPEYRITHEDLISLVNAISWLGRIYYGVINNTIYNVGSAANNISQQTTYKIIATSLTDESLEENQLKLLGRNPKCITGNLSSLNPDWPGEGSRLEGTGQYYHLPPGAMAVFGWPSVLQNKMNPFIERIDAPDYPLDDCEFIVTLTNDCSCAMTPADLLYGDIEDYYITFYYYQYFPENWPFIQPAPSTGWISVRETIIDESLTNGIYTIPYRIIYPDMFPELTARVFACKISDSTGIRNAAWENLDVITIRDNEAWSSQIDFSKVIFGNLISIELLYFREAEVEAAELWTRSSCTNSVRDWSNSYSHDEDNYCSKRISADGLEEATITPYFATFRDECWQPNCPFFSLTPSFNCCTPDWLARLISNVDIYINQGIPGVSNYSNFSIERSSGGHPSLALMAGFFVEGVSNGIGHSKKDLYNRSVTGQRVEYDDNGDSRQFLRYGAFWGRNSVAETGYAFDMNDMEGAVDGLYPAKVEGFQTSNLPDGVPADGANDPNKVCRNYPYRNSGGVHLYDFDVNYGYCSTQQIETNKLAFVVYYGASDKASTEEANIISSLRERLE